ncbi:hypothetical protein FB45DRAFT_957998 [Roridomyces roridus]|uniref:Metallo-beta-lactamase domain-containing protein n=1 Tax=Roridomyces roridus TaxID=1738132 RepID=A0AAD7AYE5_9AGAR|nr:hypothetical protein FB45DRAFT_957998 [Roridomyces roridus]
MFLPSSLLLLLAGQAHASYKDFGIPHSSATVSVKVFNVGFLELINATHTFANPVVPGHESVTFPMYSFLIEHNTSKSHQTRHMFDLGIRKDPENLAPAFSTAITAGLASLKEDKDITEQLEDGGIPLTSIDAVIWSHSHIDHIGDMSKFPSTTGLIYGQGTNTETFNTTFPNAQLQESDFAGHNITEVDFSNTKLSFSGLPAIDFFGDGSFYLLNTPGHALGHMSALARVTPTTFISMGGDTFHHVAEARPFPDFQHNFPCPGDLVASARSTISTDFFWSPRTHNGSFDIPSRAQPLLSISDLPDSVYVDPSTAAVSLEKIATFDADEDILVLVAHDASAAGSLPYFPASLNGWKKAGLKKEIVWNFVNASNPAFFFDVTA